MGPLTRYEQETKGNVVEGKGTVDRGEITPEAVAEALRLLRIRHGLTQKELAIRAREFSGEHFGKLLESQISDFERGRALPSFGSLLNLLAGYSSSGKAVDFSMLQAALTEVISSEVGADELAEITSSKYMNQKLIQTEAEMKDLRTRIANMERLLVANGSEG